MEIKFKRIVSAFLASMLGLVTSISGLCVSSDFSHIFTYKESNGNNVLVGLVDNYQDLLGGITEITLPETYGRKNLYIKCNNFSKKYVFHKDSCAQNVCGHNRIYELFIS